MHIIKTEEKIIVKIGKIGKTSMKVAAGKGMILQNTLMKIVVN